MAIHSETLDLQSKFKGLTFKFYAFYEGQLLFTSKIGDTKVFVLFYPSEFAELEGKPTIDDIVEAIDENKPNTLWYGKGQGRVYLAKL